MKKYILVCLALGACAPQQPTVVVLPAQQIQALQATCQMAGPTLAVAAQPSMPATVSETALPADAYCRQLASGILPPTTDSNTSKWLPKVIKGVQIAAEVARVAIPLIAPLF